MVGLRGYPISGTRGRSLLQGAVKTSPNARGLGVQRFTNRKSPRPPVVGHAQHRAQIRDAPERQDQPIKRYRVISRKTPAVEREGLRCPIDRLDRALQHIHPPRKTAGEN